MLVTKICAAASAGLAASLLALAAAGPAAAATPAAGRVTPAATENFVGEGETVPFAESVAQSQADQAGFSPSECTLFTFNEAGPNVWFATISCTD